MKLVTRTLADFSTAHVTLQDISQLAWAAEMFRLNKDHTNIWHYDEGFFVYCGDVNADFAELQAKFRFSDHLMKLIRLGTEGGCAYINIDQDGTQYDELDGVDWDEVEYGKFHTNCMQNGLGALKEEDWIATVVGDLAALGVDVVSLEAWLEGDHFAVTALSFYDPSGCAMKTNSLTEDHAIKALRWLGVATLGTNRQWQGTDVRVNLRTSDAKAAKVRVICDPEGLDTTICLTNRMEVTIDSIQKRIRRS